MNTSILNLTLTDLMENVSKTAEFIGMERSALHRKLNNLVEIENFNKK